MFRAANYLLGALSRFLPTQSAESATYPSPLKVHPCGPKCPYDPSVRTIFTDTEAHVFVWPSKGGMIILNSADAIDFEFLGLDPLDPPSRRLSDQAAEDVFCQRLLLLRAKWWDSEARYDVVSAIEDEAQGDLEKLSFQCRG